MRMVLPSVLLSALFLIPSCVTESEPDNVGLSAGGRLPDFSVMLNDGTSVSNVSLKGEVAVIEFFNTSCGDCQRSLPVLQQLYDRCKTSDDICVFAIARDEDKASVAGYWHDNGLSVPFSPQPDRQIYNLFASSGIPRIFIADKTGMITDTYAPEDEPSLQALIYAVEDAGASVPYN